jgi:hypothetical protein
MGNDPFNAWTIFLTQMIGLSVATERVTETIKQWIGPALSDNLGIARYAGAVQTIAILSGILVTALSGLNPINIPLYKPFDWGNKADWLAWAVTGVLVSGGSAVWNHLLDILQATKVQKEQVANSAASAADSPAIAR